MKNITLFLSALVALLFSVAETSAQITPPYYNPANVNITGGNINGTVIGGTAAAASTFTTATFNSSAGTAGNRSFLDSPSGDGRFGISRDSINYSYFDSSGSNHGIGTAYAGNFYLRYNNVDTAAVTSTGLAVTGTLSASGSISSTSNAGSTLNLTGAGANTPSHVLLRNTTAGGASPGVQFYNGDGYRHYFQEGIGAAGLNLVAVDGTPFNIAANTAVTGTLSATKNTDGEQAFTLLNNSAGTSAYSIAQVTNGTSSLQLFQTGTGFTPSGIYPTDGSVIGASGAGGLKINASHASGTLKLLTQGVERMAISSTGLAVTGTLSATGLLSGTAGVQFRGADATSYELLRVVGAGANNPGLFVKATEATKTVELFQSGSAGGEILVVGGIATYTSTALTLGSGVNLVTANDVIMGKTITAPGTTGAQTINKTTGRVNFAAAATSLVVTNSLATANSICHVTKATNDATMRLGACVAAAGSITIYADVAPAAETAVNFTVTN